MLATHLPNKNNGRPIYVFNAERVLIKKCLNRIEAAWFTGIDHSKVPNLVKYEKPCSGYILSHYLEPKLKIQFI